MISSYEGRIPPIRHMINGSPRLISPRLALTNLDPSGRLPRVQGKTCYPGVKEAAQRSDSDGQELSPLMT